MQSGGQYGLPEMQEFMLATGGSMPHHFFSSQPHDSASGGARAHHFFHHNQQQQQLFNHQTQIHHQQHQHQTVELLDLYRIQEPHTMQQQQQHHQHHHQHSELQRPTQAFFEQLHHHLQPAHTNMKSPAVETTPQLPLTHGQMNLAGGPDSPPTTDMASPLAVRPPAGQANHTQYKQLLAAAAAAAANANREMVPAGCGDEFGAGDLSGEIDDNRGGAGSRWPREETLALLRVRSEMDAIFRDSGSKAPLWEEVSRRLLLIGYQRSAKKCKEKFENLHKYYKKTKDVKPDRRQDGKTYRFRTELEAIYAASQENEDIDVDQVSMDQDADAAGLFGSIATPSDAGMIESARAMCQGTEASSDPNSSSSAASFGAELQAEAGGGAPPVGGDALQQQQQQQRLHLEHQQQPQLMHEMRKRKRSSRSSWRSMRAFFEDLATQLMERQDALQKQFLAAIERRDEERLKREEVYRRQEMERMNREQEMRAQEQSLAATRDAALVAFLQKVTGETLHLPEIPPPVPATASGHHHHHHHHHGHHHHQQQQQHTPASHHHLLHGGLDGSGNNNNMTDPVVDHQLGMATVVGGGIVDREIGGGGGVSSLDSNNTRRWPKVEVLALIRIRTNLEPRFQEAGPKAQLWEEVSTSMACLGFSRSSKRCKEKWENINKYFRKTKDSAGRKRADSTTSKTCPYFHQLEELYERGILSSPNSGAAKFNAKLDGQQQLSDEPLESCSKDEHDSAGHHTQSPSSAAAAQQQQQNLAITNTQLCMMNGYGHDQQQHKTSTGQASSCNNNNNSNATNYLDVKPLSEHPPPGLINVNNQPALHLGLIQAAEQRLQLHHQQQHHHPDHHHHNHQDAGVSKSINNSGSSGAVVEAAGFVREMIELQQKHLVDEYERLEQQVQREQVEAAHQQEISRQLAQERSYRDSATLMALVHKLASSGGGGGSGGGSGGGGGTAENSGGATDFDLSNPAAND